VADVIQPIIEVCFPKPEPLINHRDTSQPGRYSNAQWTAWRRYSNTLKRCGSLRIRDPRPAEGGGQFRLSRCPAGGDGADVRWGRCSNESRRVDRWACHLHLGTQVGDVIQPIEEIYFPEPEPLINHRDTSQPGRYSNAQWTTWRRYSNALKRCGKGFETQGQQKVGGVRGKIR
jgi:hypothetical protein